MSFKENNVSGKSPFMVEQNITFAGWPNCIRLSNREIELVLTTDVGPRIVSLGYMGGQNLFHVVPEHAGKTGGDAWRIYGGHRLWHAPEAMPRSYCPDNQPVEHSINEWQVTLQQPMEKSTRVQKQLTITLSPEANEVAVVHRITNHNLWDIQLSVWPITVFAPGGVAIIPHEPYRSESEYLLPARSVSLWHFTNMRDPAWVWGEKFLQVVHSRNAGVDQKIGFLNKQGWCAYALGGDLFTKMFDYREGEVYPDYGCNNEIFFNSAFVELESLGPLSVIKPGEYVEHREHWMISRSSFNETEKSIEDTMLPIIASFRNIQK